MYTVKLKRWSYPHGFKPAEIVEHLEQITTAHQWYHDFISSGQKLDLKPGEGAMIEIYNFTLKISDYFIKPLND